MLATLSCGSTGISSPQEMLPPARDHSSVPSAQLSQGWKPTQLERAPGSGRQDVLLPGAGLPDGSAVQLAGWMMPHGAFAAKPCPAAAGNQQWVS